MTDARRTAREQIAAARARARELRQRAKAHRHKVGIDRQPSVALGLIVLVVLAAIFGGVYLISTSASPPSPIMAGAVDAERFPHAVRARSNRSGQTVTVEADRARASGRRDRSVAAGTVNSRSSAPPAPVTEPAAPELPYLLINDHPAKADFFVHARVQSILKDYESRGWTLLTDIDAEAEARKSLPTRAEDVKMTALLAVTLAERDLGGILYIDAAPGDAPAHKRVRVRELAVPEMATVEDPVEELVGAP